jgi:hypothetical protein
VQLPFARFLDQTSKCPQCEGRDIFLSSIKKKKILLNYSALTNLRIPITHGSKVEIDAKEWFFSVQLHNASFMLLPFCSGGQQPIGHLLAKM